MGASWMHLRPVGLKRKRAMVIVAAEWALHRRTMGASWMHLHPFGLKRKRAMAAQWALKHNWAFQTKTVDAGASWIHSRLLGLSANIIVAAEWALNSTLNRRTGRVCVPSV